MAGAQGGTVTGIDLARHIADFYHHQEHGALFFRVDTQTNMHGGPISRHDADSAAYVIIDGAFVKKRALSGMENGVPLSPADLAKKSGDPEGPLSRLGMRLPYDDHAVDDYTYDAPAADGENEKLTFHSKVRDEAHGDGTLVVAPGDRPLTLTFSPEVKPQNATTAVITVHFGDVAGSMWDIVSIDRAFTGRRFFFTGSALSTSAYSYRRYPDQVAALAALAQVRESE